MPGSIGVAKSLHHDCVSVIVSRFAIVTEGLCDLLLSCHHKFFQHEVRLSPLRLSAWGPCNFGPFTDLAISVSNDAS